MKALLKFGTTEDRARELVEICRKKGFVLQQKNHGEPLTEAIIQEGGFSVNFGGYGSFSRLGLGNHFGTKWEISGLEASPSKGFTRVDVCFGSWRIDQAALTPSGCTRAAADRPPSR